MRRFAILGSLILTACTGMLTEGMYVRSGATADDFYRDRGQCEAQAYSVSRPLATQDSAVFYACLRGKGWYAKDVHFGHGSQMRFDRDSSRCSRVGGTIEARGPQWLQCMQERGWQPR